MQERLPEQEKRRQVLIFGALGFGIGAIIPFLGLESVNALAALSEHISGSRPFLESFISRSQELNKEIVVIGGLGTGVWLGINWARVRYAQIGNII